VRLGGRGEEAGTVILDPTGKKSGRGAYVCPTVECVGAALKRKSLERALKAPVGAGVALALEAAVAGSGEGSGSASG
jgi:hypothetical protein